MIYMPNYHVIHPFNLSFSRFNHTILMQLSAKASNGRLLTNNPMKNSEADSPGRKWPTFGNWLQSDVGGYPFIFKSGVHGDRFQNSFRYVPAPSDPPSSSPPLSFHVAPKSHHETRLLGSLVRKEGHIYSLAASGDLLYTGSESKRIRVWKNQQEFSSFKSNSGLVKAIIIAGERIFSGHQDGKIRIWKASPKDPSFHKRVGTMPTFRAKIKSSFNPSNYIEDRRHRNTIWITHTDAISCLSLSEDKSLLYSASWDNSFKVWRISDSKCLESIGAHDDTVNSIVAACDGFVFTGSADGTVKVWRRQMQGKKTKHILVQTLLNQECAVTSLAVAPSAKYLYCGSSDGIVNFWECGTFLSHGGVMKGHKLAVLCLATAGELVFSGSADMNICVWKRDGGEHECLSVLTGHSGPVKCLAVEEEEKGGGVLWRGGVRHYTVYSGSIDKSVKIWKVTQAAPAPPRLPSRPYHQMAEFLYGTSTCQTVAG